MFYRLSLPTLLSAFLLSSLLKASLPQVAQAGENAEEEAAPMMMERRGKPDSHKKDSPEKDHQDSRGNSNFDSTQSRSNLIAA
jgi:hypothetical protein